MMNHKKTASATAREVSTGSLAVVLVAALNLFVYVVIVVPPVIVIVEGVALAVLVTLVAGNKEAW